jgi:DNA-directed RNA polymerase specialized sigma24 family protein
MSTRLSPAPTQRTGESPLLPLVRRIADEDTRAFADLHDAVSATILGKLQSPTRDPAEAAAIASATFVEVWSMARFHSAPGTDVDAWLANIVARRSADRDVNAGPSADPSDVAGHRTPCAAIVDHDRQTLLTLAALLAHSPRPVG